MISLPSPAHLRDWLKTAPRPLALVPTMGALHEGHLALIDHARNASPAPESVIVSIFVNPAQFGPNEDLNRYPRPLEDDLAKLADRNVDAVFLPTADQLYPPGRPAVAIDVPELAAPLEGRHRPGHFAGVCRVCLKLFNLTQPDTAVFGEKDYQQLAVIRAMVADLDLPLRILAAPTVRSDQGLALSSRNQYLSDTQRQQAIGLSRALAATQQAFANDPALTPPQLEQRMHAALIEHHLTTDYAAARDPHTLQPLPTNEPAPANTRLLIAAHCGQTRLIDNAPLAPP
ncbi:MAG: pantoate--beta-alanine ligase [Planctomycetota bacterium]